MTLPRKVVGLRVVALTLIAIAVGLPTATGKSVV